MIVANVKRALLDLYLSDLVYIVDIFAITCFVDSKIIQEEFTVIITKLTIEIDTYKCYLNLYNQ